MITPPGSTPEDPPKGPFGGGFSGVDLGWVIMWGGSSGELREVFLSVWWALGPVQLGSPRVSFLIFQAQFRLPISAIEHHPHLIKLDQAC